MVYLRSIRLKILVSLCAVILCFGFGMILFAKTIVYHKLHDKLLDKGVMLSKRVAADCVNPLLTERYFEITMLLKDLKASEKDVIYGYVLNEDGRDVAHTFAHGAPQELISAHQANLRKSFSTKILFTDKGSIQDIAVPLLHGQIGVLHIGFSEGAIKKDVSDIVKAIVLFSVVVLLVGIAASLVLSRAITKPLLELAGAAEAFGRGELSTKVDIVSNDEVGELARIFNAMAEKRRQIEAQREELISDLQGALAEVNLLSGFLPICSSCKKIRDDKGYWNQLESYISKHSDVEFSHSVCPECARKLYPGLVDDDGNIKEPIE